MSVNFLHTTLSMPMRSVRHSLLLLSVLVLLVGAFSTYAQEETESPTATELSIFDNFYNHADGWHILIPTGWTNESTNDFARFKFESSTIYAIGYPDESDIDTVINQAIMGAFPQYTDAPIDTRVINLINGEWTQNIYAQGDERAVVHAQNYEGTFYVVIFSGDVNALPLVVMQDGASDNTALVEQATSEGARLVIPELGDLTDTTTQTSETQPPVTTVIQTYDNAGQITSAIGRPRGSAVYVIAGQGELDLLVESSAYFTSLTDFFITPFTLPYLALGVGLSAVIALILIASLILRRRNLLKDEATLRQLEAETA